MGLRIRQAPLRKVRVITTIIAAFALVAQPMANIVQVATANAISPAGTTVVRPGAMSGWMGVDDNGNGGSLAFSAAPAGAPLGDGSAQLKVTATNQGYLLFKPGYAGLKIADLTTLSYKTNVTTGNGVIAPSLQMNVDRDTTDGDTSWQGRLVYEPYMNGTVQNSQWQTWNALSGKWWLSKADKFDGHCGQGSPCTFAQLKGYFANIGMSSSNPGVGFKAGSGWGTFAGNIDDFMINQDRYDFEPSQGPSLVSPANSSIVKGATLVNKWSPVDGAVKYIYESYHNAAATQLRWHEETAATQKSAANVANGTTFWWRVKSVDAGGNVSGWSDLWKVTIDNVAPTAPTGGQPHSAYERTNEFDFTWSPSIDTSPVTYEFQSTQNPAESNGVLTTGLWKSGVLPTPMIHSSGAGDGVWYWQVRATDAAGNVGAWSPVWHMTIDSHAPVVSIDAPLASSVTGTVTVSGSMSDANPSHYYFVVKNANGTVVAGPKTVNKTTVASWQWNTTLLPEGDYTIVLEARDKADNKDTSLSIAKKVVTIDRTAPTTVVTNPFAGQVVGGDTLELKGTVTDPSGISEYRYQLLDGNKDNTLGNSVIGGHGEVVNDSLGSLAIGNLPSGDYYVRLWAKDGLGNTSAPVYVKFTVDHTAPVVTLQADNASPMASSAITFSGMVLGGSDIASLKLYKDGTELVDVTSTIDTDGKWLYAFPAGFAQGDYTFKVEATDIYGNKSDELVSPQSVLAMSFSQYLPGGGAGIPPEVTRQLTQALAIPGAVSAAIPTPDAQNNDQDVLGTETEKDSAVKGAADTLAAIAPTENGWKLFGLVWYWWLLILGVLSLIIWRLVTWMRREDDVLPA